MAIDTIQVIRAGHFQGKFFNDFSRARACTCGTISLDPDSAIGALVATDQGRRREATAHQPIFGVFEL
jgi:hypothetical protein